MFVSSLIVNDGVIDMKELKETLGLKRQKLSGLSSRTLTQTKKDWF
jgi:hypothetical protein